MSNVTEGIWEFATLRGAAFGRAKLLLSRTSGTDTRLSRSFALPIPGHHHVTRDDRYCGACSAVACLMTKSTNSWHSKKPRHMLCPCPSAIFTCAEPPAALYR